MGRYVLKRIGASILTLFVVISLTFFMMRALPGGPFTDEKSLPPEVMKEVMERYKMNDPLYEQYFDYIKNVLKLDLGPSYRYEGKTVNSLIEESFPISARIGGLAILFSLIIGIPIGVISAIKRGKIADKVAFVISVMGVTIPNFVLATILIYIFILKLGWTSVGTAKGFSNLVLPAITLAGFPTAFIARIVRSSMLEVIQQDYIKTAKAKGMSEKKVMYVHALKNALMPVLTYLGPLTAGILTGSFVVEQIFAIPGLGTYFVTSIQNRDYTTILGVTIFYSILLVTFNLIIDISYALLDSRIELE